jgi:CHASE3 domain sensor protein
MAERPVFMPRRIFLFGVLLLVFAAVYTAASAWMTFGRIAQLQRAGQSATQSQQIRSALNAFVVAVLDVESSTRGFTLSGDPATLVLFDAGRRQVPALLDELRDLLRDNPVQLARVQQLVPLVAEHIAVSELAIAHRRSQPGETPDAAHAGNAAANASASIRRIVDEIDLDERRDLVDRKIQWGRELDRSRETEVAAVLSSFLVIALLGWALVRLRRYVPPGAPDLREVPNATAGFPADPGVAAAVFVAPQCGVGARLHDALTHAQLARDAFERDSREWTRMDVLRQGIADALDRHDRVVEEMALPAMQRIGLAVALQGLVDRYRRRELFEPRESIDFSLRVPDTGHAHLLYQAASGRSDSGSSRYRRRGQCRPHGGSRRTRSAHRQSAQSTGAAHTWRTASSRGHRYRTASRWRDLAVAV